MDDDCPDAQPWNMPSDEPEEDSDVEEDTTPRGLTRSSAGIWAPTNVGGFYTPGKAPRSVRGAPAGWGGGDEARDLGAFFEEWDIPRAEQVVICRGWANYNAALEKSINNKKQKK